MIITTAAIKGGTGKTATAGAIAQAAAHDGKKILAVDLDPQANLSIWLDADLNKPGSYELITGASTNTIQATESGIDIIPATANLTALKTSPGSARRLERTLAPYRDEYDLIITDTGPGMGEILNNALYAADGLLIPLEADANSLQGLYQIMDITNHIQQSKTSLKVLGMVVTRYDPRPKINRFMLETIQERGKEIGVPFLKSIRQGVAIREAMAMQCSLFDYAPRSKPAADYSDLYKKIMEG